MATNNNTKSSTPYHAVLDRFNKVAEQYASSLPLQAFYSAFSRMGYTANMPQVQNQRVKQINSLPVEYNKEQIHAFLRKPNLYEGALRNTSEVLKWTTYPYLKIIKTYADIPTYKYYTKPLYLDETQSKSAEFKREQMLVDKINKAIKPEICAHKIAGQALSQGKVAYTYRIDIDKSHNKVNYAFLQQLPEDWIYIIGYNNISGYTVSFNMMYFLEIGTDYKQYGDLFEPFLDDFNDMFKPRSKDKKFVYASKSVKCKGKKIAFYPQNVKANAAGNPNVFEQNGRWFYYVSLPIDKVFVFEIDDTVATMASPFSGLMLGYAQLGDYENIQKELVTNPLLKIFTGEIPYFSENTGAKDFDGYRLSEGGRLMFETMFEQLMKSSGIGGTAFYTAPVSNIKSHDYPETATANETSEAYNRYLGEKSGTTALIPNSEDVKASQVEVAKLLEGKFVTSTIYPQFCRMMNSIYDRLNLNYQWEFNFVGTVFTEDKLREYANTEISNGDLSAYYILAALDGQSICDKLSMINAIGDSGMLEKLTPPMTSYTMPASADRGRPQKSIEEIGAGEGHEETERQKDTFGVE